MATRTYLLLLAMAALSVACSRMSLHEDYGNAVTKNKQVQAANVSAAQESHPEVMMDGQKAVGVVDNYRKEGPEVDDADLTK